MKIIEQTINQQQRFVIVNSDTGHVLDNAQGYGYKTKQSASKALWFKFKNGKVENSNIAHSIKAGHTELRTAVNELYTAYITEIANGEFTEAELVDYLVTEFGITLTKR